MKQKISIIGSGTYGEVIYELVTQLDYEVLGFYDDNKSKHGNYINSVPVLGNIDFNKIDVENNNFVVAIGDNAIRSHISKIIVEKGGFLPNLIHPSVIISESATLGQGCVLHANSFIWTNVNISDFTIISVNANIAHHTTIKTGCFISTGANIGANITIESKSFIGIGAIVMTGVKLIGKSSVIGAGAVIIKDVPDYAVVVGNPGKVIKTVNHHNLTP
ncbi:acetyltransferase [Flagellimonas beolgyonensis]|uniref:acetyltransferase n=1 Tax=Flagellimonas beolgyonensis TaxID=864064 RepID=UPI000F8C9B3F|nr:acetyltransferase [Allomuricauda beolgyonensis]